MQNDQLTLASARGPSGPRNGRALPPWVSTTALLMPTYGWLTIAVFLPLLTMFAFSFLSATPMGKAPIIFTLKQYRAFYDQPYLVGIGITSLLIGFWTTLICAVLGFLAAVALVRSTFGKTREMLLILILLPFWTNGLVRVFSWTMVLRENGFLDSLLHMISCKAAIKAGDRLSEAEIAALLEQRHLAQDAHHCPHGRPTALFFSREELDRQFMRT